MRLRTVIILVLAAIVLLPLAALGYLLTMGPEDLKDLIIARVEAQTGRQLAINGRFEIDLSLTPSVIAEDITFQNAEWGSRPELARVGYIEVAIDLVPLIGGTIDLSRIALKDADILIETDAGGRSNLDFRTRPAAAVGDDIPPPAVESPVPSAAPPGPPPTPNIPIVRDADFDNVTVVFKNQASGDVRTLHVAEIDIDGLGAQTPLDVSMIGDFDQVAIEIVGQLGSPAQMLTPTEAWPLSLVGTAGGISLDIAGTMTEPTAARGLDVAIQARGPEIAALGHLFATEIPRAGPFKILVTVLGDLDGTLALQDIDAELGQTEEMTLTARGTVGSVFEAENVDLALTAEGAALETLAAIVGQRIPPVGPYRAAAQVKGDLGGTLALSDLDAEIGVPETVRITAQGDVASVMQGGGIALDLSAEGTEWGRLRQVLPDGLGPVSFPDIGPFDVAASVRGDVDGILAVDGLRVDLGGPDTLSLVATGAVASAMDGGGIDVTAELQGAEFKDLVAMLPADFVPGGDRLPQLGPFRIGLTALGDANGVLAIGDIDASVGRSEFVSLGVEGSVASVMVGDGLDLRLHAVGADLGMVNDVLPPDMLGDIRLPALGPFDVIVRLQGDASGALSLSDLDARLGARKTVQVTARGAVEDLRAGRGINLQARLEGWETGRLNTLVPPGILGNTTLPSLGPYDVAGTVTGNIDGVFAVTGLNAAIGTEDRALITAEGTVTDVRAIQGLDLQVGARGGSLAALSPAVGAELPETDPFSFSAAVKGNWQEELSIGGLVASIGESDLAGDLDVAFKEARPSLRARVESRRLDLDALRGLAAVEAPVTPQAGPGVTAVPPIAGPATPVQQPSAGPDGGRRVIPNDPLPVDDLKALDLDAEVQVAELIFDGQRIDSAQAKVDLVGGKLTLDPLQGGLDGGLISGNMVLDASLSEPALSGQLTIRQYNLGSLLAARRIMQGFRGRADITMSDLTSNGRTLRALSANLNGTLALRMGAGSMDAGEVNQLSGGAADLARLLLGGGQVKDMTINCIDLRYAVSGGVMRTEKALLDTDIVTVMGSGDANLATERLDLFVGGRPKGRALAPEVALKIGGTFADPEFKVDKTSAVGAAGGLFLGEVLGKAVPGSSALSGLIGTLSGGSEFPCQGIPGASNVKIAERQPEKKREETPKAQGQDGEKDKLEEKLNRFLEGILGQ